LKAKNQSLQVSTAVGLLVLLGFITIFVLVRSPRNVPPPDEVLAAHESGLYYIEAETLARPLLPAPSARWSHLVLDEGTGCRPIANGIWQAAGTVAFEGKTIPWEIFFVPEKQTLIFAKVGERQSGDPEALSRMTRHSPPGHGSF
jgi:hypothetical protein